MTLSLRMRLTVWYTCALVLVVGLFGADILWQQGRIGLRRTDRELAAFSDTLSNVLADELRESSSARHAALEAERTVTAAGHAVAILDADGMELAASWNGLTLSPARRTGLPRHPPAPGAFVRVPGCSGPARSCCSWRHRCSTCRGNDAKRRKPWSSACQSS